MPITSIVFVLLVLKFFGLIKSISAPNFATFDIFLQSVETIILSKHFDLLQLQLNNKLLVYHKI